MNASNPPASRFRRILFCTDFSESADAAFPFALDATVRRPGATLHILHVVHEVEAQFWKSYIYEVDNVDDEARRAIDEKMRQSYLDRIPAGVPVQVDYRVGPEAATILDYAREQQIDLLVIGRHGHGGVQAALFGKVAEKLVRKADCAVLVVPLSYAAQETEVPPQG